MIRLVRPDVSRHPEWLDLVAESGGAHLDGSGLDVSDIEAMADPQRFARWVEAMADQESGRHVPEGRVPCTYRWIEGHGALVGMINLRHELTDRLLHYGGHIGYAVRPTARSHGVARVALRLMLQQAGALGINPVLLYCRDDNTGSIRTIEGAGGALEGIREEWRRYWITDSTRPPGYAVRPLAGCGSSWTAEPLRGLLVELPLVGAELADAMRSGVRDPSWADGFPRPDDVDSLRFVAAAGTSDARWGTRLVVRRRDARVVGTIGFTGPPDLRGQVEIGFGIVESARGHGLVTDALRLTVPAAEAAGAHVRARTASDNLASRRVLESAGFLLVGRADAAGSLRYERRRP